MNPLNDINVALKMEIGQELPVTRGAGDDLELGLMWDFTDGEV
jgi:hypothetical protein